MVQRLLDLGVRWLGAVPYRLGPRAARLLGRAGYAVYLPERRLAAWNLRHCYAERSATWRRRIAVRFFEHLVTSAYEVFHAVQNPQETERLISFRHGERLTEALRLGRGVVVVTGHYGNFALLAFALRASSPDAAFIARASKRRIGPLIGAARAYYRGSLKPLTGMHVLPSSLAGARQSTRLLRRGNLVIIFADLTWGMGSIEVNFLGVPHGVSRAPASLALRTGAVLLPVITRRTPAGRLQILVENPILPPEGESSPHLAERRMLEVQVRACPEQWYWLHRSWRPARSAAAR